MAKCTYAHWSGGDWEISAQSRDGIKSVSRSEPARDGAERGYLPGVAQPGIRAEGGRMRQCGFDYETNIAAEWGYGEGVAQLLILVSGIGPSSLVLVGMWVHIAHLFYKVNREIRAFVLIWKILLGRALHRACGVRVPHLLSLQWRYNSPVRQRRLKELELESAPPVPVPGVRAG